MRITVKKLKSFEQKGQKVKKGNGGRMKKWERENMTLFGSEVNVW